MPAWFLIACLVSLRDEFNTLAPGRDKGADGAIGDSAHTSRSDHSPDEQSIYLRDHDADAKNEVHAVDVDSSGPWPGTGTQKQRFHRIVMRIIAGERAKWLSTTDKCRLEYVIWDGKIYSRSRDFEPREYTSTSDPHTGHAHFSGRYLTATEADIRPWNVLDSTPIDKDGDDMADFGNFLYEAAKATDPDVSQTNERQIVARVSRNIMGPEIALALGTAEAAAQAARIEALLTRIADSLDVLANPSGS